MAPMSENVVPMLRGRGRGALVGSERAGRARGRGRGRGQGSRGGVIGGSDGITIRLPGRGGCGRDGWRG